VSLTYVTVDGNAGGIADISGGVVATGVIVDGNAGGNCSGSITEHKGYNLDSGPTCGFSLATDVTGQPAHLGTLKANGGPTQTQSLLAGSPAIDRGGAGSCPPVDQRGRSRPDEAADHGACDLGAYES
jgi:hypothetical protein